MFQTDHIKRLLPNNNFDLFTFHNMFQKVSLDVTNLMENAFSRDAAT
jgi:hypothetical protein